MTSSPVTHPTQDAALIAALALSETTGRRVWVYKSPGTGRWISTFEGAIAKRYEWEHKIGGPARSTATD